MLRQPRHVAGIETLRAVDLPQLWRGLGFPAARVKPIRIHASGGLFVRAPLFVEQSMSKVPWRLIQDRQRRAHLVVGVVVRGRCCAG